MSGPHPDAVGSYGPELAAWSKARTGLDLRWWQRLAANRLLEYDRDGALVWPWWIISTARQVGKSWLLRELLLWRIHQGDRFGEPQLVLHTGKDLPVCREVQRPARAWARVQPGFTAREANGMEEIEHPDGSRWMIRGRGSVYGYSASLGAVDEAWKVAPEVVEDGLEPTMAERASAQLGLLSTAHRMATALVPARREAALAQLLDPRDTLLLEWSAQADATLTDRAAWRQASPHWTARRERLVASQHERAVTAGPSDDPDEPDPVEAFRSQWLNIWATRQVTTGRAEPLVDATTWADLATLQGPPPGALVLAVEDNYGRGAAVIAAARLPDGTALVWGRLMTTRTEAWSWAEMRAAEHPGSRLLTGPGLDTDPGAAAVSAATRQGVGGVQTRAGLALIRDLVATGRLHHDGSADLGQVATARVVPSATGGLALAGGGRHDLTRAVAWAVRDLMRPAEVAATPFVIR
jgi:hypothetical protein